MNHNDEEWGEDRMIATSQQLLAQPNCTHTARQLLDCILAAADKFTDGAPQHDDMTLLVCTIACSGQLLHNRSVEDVSLLKV
jgi:sigma-B regulation protein RsbU (phosphoserine phosphatase)